MFYLRKQNDHSVGDSGSMSLRLTPVYDENGKIVDVIKEHDARPRVKSVIRVGSPFARSYSSQDWWQTSFITEILVDDIDRMVFKTASGSIYEWGSS